MEQLNRPGLAEYQGADKLPVIILLDNIRSGLNVGAIFRTCDAFAVESICLCGITAQPPHVEIMKTALGATESVKWNYDQSTLHAITGLKSKGYAAFAIEQTDESVSLAETELNFDIPKVFVFGNEMRGISAEVLAACDGSIEIPQSGIKHSLNVATSAGIILWEYYRQFLRRRLLSSTE